MSGKGKERRFYPYVMNSFRGLLLSSLIFHFHSVCFDFVVFCVQMCCVYLVIEHAVPYRKPPVLVVVLVCRSNGKWWKNWTKNAQSITVYVNGKYSRFSAIVQSAKVVEGKIIPFALIKQQQQQQFLPAQLPLLCLIAEKNRICSCDCVCECVFE